MQQEQTSPTPALPPSDNKIIPNDAVPATLSEAAPPPRDERSETAAIAAASPAKPSNSSFQNKQIPNLGRQVPAIGGTGLAIAAEQQRRNANKTAMTTRMKEWAKKLWQPLRWVLLVVAVFTVLALASVWNMKRAKTFSKAELSRIQSLLQYSAKSAQEAERAERDDPLQALLHANYALCYLNACKHIVDTKTIESLLGTNAAELDAYLQDLQHRQLSKLYSE